MSHDPIADVHSDAWWMRVCEGELSPQEEADWQAHLAQCETCQQEWAALTQVDALLRTAAPPPTLAPDFTARTVERITHKQKLRHMLRFVVGILVLGLVAWIGWSFFGVTLANVVHTLEVMISGRQVLFAALMRTLVGLAVTVKALLPLLLGIAGAIFLFLTPNSILASVVVVWYSRRKRAAGTAT
ncbi:MAG: anti-sigma factor family protein [Anaerolineae bacterium]